LKVNERPDDTTKPEAESRAARAPGRYYYDDATGYEIYTPEADEGAEDEGRREGEGVEDDKDGEDSDGEDGEDRNGNA
jgi:hypothetical protein